MTEKNIPRVQVDNPESADAHAAVGAAGADSCQEDRHHQGHAVGRGQSRLHGRRQHLWRHAGTDRAAAGRIPRRRDHRAADGGRRRVGWFRRPRRRRQPHRHDGAGLLSQGDQQHLRRRRAAGDSARQGDGSFAHQAARRRRRLHGSVRAAASRSFPRRRPAFRRWPRCRRWWPGIGDSTAATPITSVVNTLDRSRPSRWACSINSTTASSASFRCLQRNNILKVLAEPTLVTTSGRPAYFLSGGEMPIPVPQSLGTISIQFRKFGTQVDFVPIVLGSGRIHLEVRPKISEIDPTVSITLNGSTIPGFRTRECDTGVEMNAGQTLALAGLTDTADESELLITVRAEVGEGMNREPVKLSDESSSRDDRRRQPKTFDERFSDPRPLGPNDGSAAGPW